MTDGMDAIVQRFRAGDAEAVEQVFCRYRYLVHALASLEVHDIHDADDVTQEVFRRAIVSAHTLSDATKLRPWLLSIARNFIHDQRKRARPQRLSPDRDEVENRAWQRAWKRGGETADDDPATAAIRRERAEKVRRMMAMLPDRFRAPVALRLLAERSYREIATILDLPYTTVKNLIARGGRMLIERLRADAENGGLEP
ncbi:MAG: RNA polymerase sigma factor [Planctomycetota bacterium]